MDPLDRIMPFRSAWLERWATIPPAARRWGLRLVAVLTVVNLALAAATPAGADDDTVLRSEDTVTGIPAGETWFRDGTCLTAGGAPGLVNIDQCLGYADRPSAQLEDALAATWGVDHATVEVDDGVALAFAGPDDPTPTPILHPSPGYTTEKRAWLVAEGWDPDALVSEATDPPPVGPVQRWRPLVERYFDPPDVAWAMAVIRCESEGNPGARNPRSTASGLFQHLASKWPTRSTLAGWGGASVFDPVANVAVAAWLLCDAPWGGPQHWVCP